MAIGGEVVLLIPLGCVVSPSHFFKKYWGDTIPCKQSDSTFPEEEDSLTKMHSDHLILACRI